MSQTARVNLKTIDGITTNINATVTRLEGEKDEKETLGNEFLAFIMQEPKKLAEDLGKLELNFKKAIRATDLVDTDPLTDAIKAFKKQFIITPIHAENIKLAREDLLDIFRPAYGHDTHTYSALIVQAGKSAIEFINKLTHFLDSIEKESREYMKGRKEGPG